MSGEEPRYAESDPRSAERLGHQRQRVSKRGVGSGVQPDGEPQRDQRLPPSTTASSIAADGGGPGSPIANLFALTVLSNTDVSNLSNGPEPAGPGRSRACPARRNSRP